MSSPIQPPRARPVPRNAFPFVLRTLSASSHGVLRPRAVALALRTAWVGALAGLAAGSALPPAPAWAQAAAGAAPAAVRGPFDIPAGPLEHTLNRLGREAGVLITFGSSVTDGLASGGVRGARTVEEALAQALRGTGLEAVRSQGGGYTLRATPAAGPVREGTGAAALPSVTVTAARTATSDVAATEGTGSYTTRSMGTATGLALSMRETPQSVSVVTRQQMDEQGLTDIAGVLERTTGITRNQNESDRTYFSARGFDVTKVQYDGLPSKDYFDYDTDAMSDVALYDRVEIVRGATGLLNGTGEPSAAINFVRKRPTAEFQGHVQLGAGSWDAYRGEVDLSGPLAAEGKVRGRLVAAYGDRRSYLEHYRKDLGALYGVVEADLPSDTLLTVGLDYQQSDTRGVTYGSPVPFFYADGSRTALSRSTSTAASWTSLERQRLAAFAHLEKALANGWKARLNYSYRTSDASPKLLYLSGYPDRATGAGVDAFSTSYDIDHRAQALDFQVSGPFTLMGREHALVAGLAYYRRDLDYKWHPLLASATLDSFYDRGAYAEPAFGDGYNRMREQDTREKSAYLTSRWHLADPLRLILGARWTTSDYDQTFAGSATSSRYSGELTPYAGLVYDFGRDYSAYVSYTDIFETQTSRDRSGALLPPKTGSNYEAGLKGELMGGRLNLSAAVFRIRQDNLPEFDTVVEGENRYRAIKGATVRGYELEASGEIMRGWSVAAGFTHRTAKDAAGEALQTMVPENLLRLTSSHRLAGAWSPVTLGGHLTWQSRIAEKGVGPNGEDAVQGRYTLVHLFASYQARKDLSLHLAVNNLLDKTYYTGIVSGYGRYGDPRNVTVSMKYRF